MKLSDEEVIEEIQRLRNGIRSNYTSFKIDIFFAEYLIEHLTDIIAALNEEKK